MNDTEGVLLGLAMVLVMMNAVMFLWDREAYFAALWRILTLYGLIPRRTKPEKARLLSPAELAAIEIECGMEPSWTPPPVASLVTRPPDYSQGGQVKPVNPVYPPKRPAGSKPPTVAELYEIFKNQERP